MSDVALESIFFPGVAQAGPTTLTLKGVPSRWFAEPRVSSKASVLVTHTIFSKFGEIRSFLNQMLSYYASFMFQILGFIKRTG